MPGVGRAATLAAAPTERSWRRVSSLVIVGSRPCSVAPVASGGRGALRAEHVVVFRGLYLAAECAHADRLVYFFAHQVESILSPLPAEQGPKPRRRTTKPSEPTICTFLTNRQVVGSTPTLGSRIKLASFQLVHFPILSGPWDRNTHEYWRLSGSP